MLSRVFEAEHFWTVVTGVIVFAICQWIMEVHVKPRQRYREIKRRVSYNLFVYAEVFRETGDTERKRLEEIATETMGLAADIQSCIETMPGSVWFLEGTSKRALSTAAHDMKLLAERLLKDGKGCVELQKNIKRSLKLYMWKAETQKPLDR